jgi:hypothetical protein
MRIQSDFSMKNGGFLHKAEDSGVSATQRNMLPMPNPECVIDASKIMMKYQSQTTYKMQSDYAERLSVDALSVECLKAQFVERDVWAWPMRGASGSCCGIRLRSDAAKWAVKGSKAGLFIPIFKDNPDWPLMICEGPTDTAAALSMGYYAIGRQSCMGQADLIKSTIKRLGRDKVIIMSDNDDPKEKPDGSTWKPGQEGARKLAIDLGMPCCIVTPKAKDIRAWRASNGCVRDEIDCIVKAKGYEVAK